MSAPDSSLRSAFKSVWPKAVWRWGAADGDLSRAYPCDQLIPEPDQEMYRSVEVDAPAGTLFLWICQLRLAPYSYDRIDNFGRQSPQKLVPGIDELEPGLEFMRIFRLDSFEPGRSVTLRSKSDRLVDSAVTYLSLDRPGVTGDSAGSRLLVKFNVRYTSPLAAPLRIVLPPGDLVMMRRQLLELKRLAEGR